MAYTKFGEESTDSDAAMQQLADDSDEFPWNLGVFDAHCHPTESMDKIQEIQMMHARGLVIMATARHDQVRVAQVADEQGLDEHSVDSEHAKGIIPSFGWHPWFSHELYDDTGDGDAGSIQQIDLDSKVAHYSNVLYPPPESREFLLSLPDPIRLSSHIARTKKNLESYPAALVGEIGLDRSFRIPDAWIPLHRESGDESLADENKEGRKLSPYRVTLEHQKKILLAQLRLAGNMQRPVSVHGVQAHGYLFDTFQLTWKGHERKVPSKRERKRQESAANGEYDESEDAMEDVHKHVGFPPRICLHSYSGAPEPTGQYLNPSVPAVVYFSFSMVVNFTEATTSKTQRVIKALPDDRILIESDLHIPGAEMDKNLELVARKVCALKGWDLNSGITQLRKNWKSFVFGNSS